MKILVKHGKRHSTVIENQEFILLVAKPKLHEGNTYFYILDPETQKQSRIQVMDYELFDMPAEESMATSEAKPAKTMEELEIEIQEKFAVMEDLYEAVFQGAIKSLIISGTAGTGKSSSIEELLEKKAKLNGYTYSTIKGVSTPLFLFEHLRENCGENHIVILDDCDSLFYENSALNVLKAALDSKPKRIVTWGSTRKTADESAFEFKGSIIFLTNIAFDKLTKNEVLKSHLQALASRSHYFDVSLHSNLERFIRIKQVCNGTDILKGRKFTENEIVEMLDFIYENLDRFTELSLRTVSKTADMFSHDNANWKKLISLTCFKR